MATTMKKVTSNGPKGGPKGSKASKGEYRIKPGKATRPQGVIVNPGEGNVAYGKRLRSESAKNRKVSGGKIMS